MADALAAREHGIHELRPIQLVAVARSAHLKPLHGIPGSVLQTQYIDIAGRLVILQHGWNRFPCLPLCTEQVRQDDGILNGQFGTGTNGEMSRVYRVPHEDHMAVAIEVRPLLALDPLKVEPS